MYKLSSTIAEHVRAQGRNSKYRRFWRWRTFPFQGSFIPRTTFLNQITDEPRRLKTISSLIKAAVFGVLFKKAKRFRKTNINHGRNPSTMFTFLLIYCLLEIYLLLQNFLCLVYWKLDEKKTDNIDVYMFYLAGGMWRLNIPLYMRFLCTVEMFPFEGVPTNWHD